MATAKPRTQAKVVETKVIKRQELSDDLWLMWLGKPEGFTHKPGQYCTIGLEGIERAYSISSAPYEDAIELFIELVPKEDGGNLTPLLYKLKEGDTVTIRPRAKGIFTFKSEYKNQFMVATVTGVVPSISFIRDYLHSGQSEHHFYILEGASYHDEFGYDDELRRLVAAYPDVVKFIPTISRPTEARNSGWEGETGRANALAQKYIEVYSLKAEDTLVYACGHPGMVEDVKAQMAAKGFPFKEERFWK